MNEDFLNSTCSCGHLVRDHNKATPNRSLRTCAECTDLCIVHLGFQPASVVKVLTHAR